MRDPAKILRLLKLQGYGFSLLEPADIPLHKEFVHRNWPGSVTRGNYKYNKWKYGKTKDGTAINLLVCKKDGIIIGQIGYVPAQINITGEIYDCVWGCNFKVDAPYKEIGIGAALEMYAATVYPIILGNTPSRESIKYKKGLGFKFLDGPRTMMFPVKANYLLKLKTPAALKQLIPLISFGVNPVLELYNRIRISGKADEWINNDEGEIINRLEEKEKNITIPHIEHDAVFIKRRCYPPSEYRGKPYLFVYKNDERSFAIYAVSSGVINLYDHFFASNEILRSFVKYLLLVPGATTIKVHANTDTEESMFKSCGFIPFRNRSVITAYSETGLFRDAEKMHVAIYDGDGDM